MAHYRFGSLYVIRLAGVPFDRLERLATPASVEKSRQLAPLIQATRDAAQDALAALRRPDAPRGELVERARRSLGQGLPVPGKAAALSPELVRYAQCLARVSAAQAELQATLERELVHARASLLTDAATTLGRFTSFAASGSLQERIAEAVAGEAGAGAGWRERARDRLHLNYLQRVCAKNDTISEFGPTAWGRLSQELHGLRMAPVPGVARRHVFLEKWVVQELAAAITADPAARQELMPRLHPCGQVEGAIFVREDLGSERPLTQEELAVVGSIDGRTPAYALGCAPALLQRLAGDGVILWQLEPLALEPACMERLIDEVSAFREGEARARWLPQLTAVAALAARFADEPAPDARQAIMDEVGSTLTRLGRSVKSRQRALYTAANPIGEECFRDCGLVIGRSLSDRLIDDSAPWFDLFSEIAAFVREHISARLRDLFATAPRRGGRVSLPAFLAHTRDAGFALDGDGLSKLGAVPFAQVQHAFQAVFSDRSAAAELEVTPQDCQALLRQLGPPPRGRRIWPSVDLQIGATDVDAVARGDYELVVGEMNTLAPIAAHVFFWACPDRTALAAELRRMIGEPRVCHRSLKVLDRATHVTFHWPEILGESWTCVAPERVHASWPQLRPAAAEVALDEHTGELRVRISATGEDLGALLNDWDLDFAFCVHPFAFHSGRHTPRLRRGRTVLQRRAWVVSAAELTGGPYPGTSPALIAAVDRLRASRDLPRHVFVRPSRATLARSASSGRDKDVKPFYVDLESYLFLEAFSHRLSKYGELEVVEMLPRPDQLLWREADGRRTFELRALLTPHGDAEP